MPSTQEDSVGQVGSAAIAMPLVDVMSLRPRGRTITPRKATSTVPNSKHDPLGGIEQPLCAT